MKIGSICFWRKLKFMLKVLLVRIRWLVRMLLWGWFSRVLLLYFMVVIGVCL